MAGSTAGKIRTAVRGLGEIALRVTNLDAMLKFYVEVIGLPLMTRVPNCAFFKIADGFGGHTQVLALFDRSQNPGYRGPDAATSTIDHIAFEIPLANFAYENSEKKRKRPRLRLKSWGARQVALPRKLLNSNLGSAPNFVNSSCVPYGSTKVTYADSCPRTIRSPEHPGPLDSANAQAHKS